MVVSKPRTEFWIFRRAALICSLLFLTGFFKGKITNFNRKFKCITGNIDGQKPSACILIKTK